ncbi:MAG: transcriptional regulator [Ectothiorhodospiraceae bacterium]|nr:transcriptional regulator [Ectothiorhodospiraceae bacterium]
MNDIVQLFHSLADSNRLRILNLLLNSGELCVCTIEDVMQVPQARVSRHLGVMRQAGLVAARREAQWVYYSAAKDTLLKSTLANVLKETMEEDSQLRRDLARLKKLEPNACELPRRTKASAARQEAAAR